MPKRPHSVIITRVIHASEELYQACLRLVPQLTGNNPPPTREQLALLLASPASFLYQAQHRDYGEEIIGLATLVVYRVPTGVRGYIEDVVVDERMRGRRIGEALMRACLEEAERQGAPQVMLTSNPARLAANRLYLRMGFEQRHTNVYRYVFKKG
jgi:ribosomal protein S18 acetylase RimI-like enzyme